MQTIKRCAYAKASYDPNSAHDLYDEKKAGLEQFCRMIMKEYKDRNLSGKNLSVSAVYSKNKNITACIYNGKLFIGFQDKETGEISFDDDSGDFVKMSEQVLEQLEIRMLNAMNAAEKDKPFLMSQELEPFWKPLHPLMEKLIDYEKEFNAFPRVKQIVLENSGIRDKQINDIIDKMQKELHPIIEEQLEEMYGVDIGHVGKRDPLSAMSDLEEKYAEEYYHADVGDIGYEAVDVCKTSLFDRFADASREAKEYREAKEEKAVKKERNNERDWRMPDTK